MKAQISMLDVEINDCNLYCSAICYRNTYEIVVESADSRIRLPEFECWISHLLPVGNLKQVAKTCLTFLICKMSVITLSTSRGYCEA